MTTFTPTATSAALAGFGFWALIWSITAKLDTIMSLFGFGNRGYSKRVRLWINQNKGLTLCITEVINFGIHGVKSAEGVVFAIGGTCFNIMYVLLINPIICMKDNRRGIHLKASKHAYPAA